MLLIVIGFLSDDIKASPKGNNRDNPKYREGCDSFAFDSLPSAVVVEGISRPLVLFSCHVILYFKSGSLSYEILAIFDLLVSNVGDILNKSLHSHLKADCNIGRPLLDFNSQEFPNKPRIVDLPTALVPEKIVIFLPILNLAS